MLCPSHQIHSCAQDVFHYEDSSAEKGKRGEEDLKHQLRSENEHLCKGLLHPCMERFLGEIFRKSSARVSSPQQNFLMRTEPLSPCPPCYQLANLPAHSDTQLREMKTVLLIDETLDKITWF